MRTQELLEKTKGYTTLALLQQELGVNAKKAIYYVHRLRKRGYVQTHLLKNRARSYHISPFNAIGGTSYIEELNKYNPIGLKIMPPEVHQIYDKELKPEELMIFALKQQRVRFVLASLGLFRAITNWSLLYKLAKKENLVRPIAALYELARRAVPKVRKMPQRFKTLAKPKKTDKYIELIDKFSSDNFQNIEKKWKVYIPMNQADLNDVRFEFRLMRQSKKPLAQKKRETQKK